MISMKEKIGGKKRKNKLKTNKIIAKKSVNRIIDDLDQKEQKRG